MAQTNDILVLIVEDTDDLAHMMTYILDEMGIQSIRAKRGRDAVAWLTENTPDLMLLDLGLPDISGWEVAESVVDRPPEARFPIIIMTAYGDPLNRTVAEFQRDVFDYITKPFQPQNLMESVREALGIVD